MSEAVRPDHMMKLLGVKPDGALSLLAGLAGDSVSVQVLSQGIIVGGQYLVAANGDRDAEVSHVE